MARIHEGESVFLRQSRRMCLCAKDNEPAFVRLKFPDEKAHDFDEMG